MIISPDALPRLASIIGRQSVLPKLGAIRNGI